MEQAEGEFVFDGTTYKVIDLPGSYGLSANSEEEVVTRDYIQSGKADLVCILVDASQLERSLYMLADFVGIRMPVMLVLNMMDVAEAAGKKIDVAAIEKRLGVPVLGFSAAETERYPEFFKKMVSAIKTPVCLDSGSLREELVGGDEFASKTDNLISRIEVALGDFEYGVCERIWIAEKLLEKDKLICGIVNESLPFARKNAIDAILDSDEGRDGGILTGEAKYRWVSKIVRESATPKSIEKVFSKWERIATHHIKGKFFAFGIMVVSLIACMILAFPGMGIGFGMQPVLQSLVERAGNAIEPVTMFFGMRWELFISYLGGMFSKEASLGSMSTLFNHTGEALSLGLAFIGYYMGLLIF